MKNKILVKVYVPSIDEEYENDKFNKILEKRKDDKEGSIRCFTCYSLRYKQLCEYAFIFLVIMRYIRICYTVNMAG